MAFVNDHCCIQYIQLRKYSASFVGRQNWSGESFICGVGIPEDVFLSLVLTQKSIILLHKAYGFTLLLKLIISTCLVTAHVSIFISCISPGI